MVQQLRRFSNEQHAPITSLTRVPDLLATGVVIAYIFSMPLNLPLELASGPETRSARPRSPEDANTVWGALSYSWMGDWMYTARTRPLRPLDVWALSLNNRAEVLSQRFKSISS